MIVYQMNGCCGFSEIHGLGDGDSAEKSMKTFTDHIRIVRFGVTFSHVLFTATARAKYGRAFAAYITAHELGDLVCSSLGKNPNSGNKIQGWIWTVNPVQLRAWAKKHEA